MSIPNGSCMPSHCRCAGALPSNATVTRDIGPHNRRKRERENINPRRKPVRGKILDMESSCESSLLYLFVFWIDSRLSTGQQAPQTGVILRDFESRRISREPRHRLLAAEVLYAGTPRNILLVITGPLPARRYPQIS